MEVKIFNRGDTVPTYIMEYTVEKEGLFIFGVDCKVITILNYSLIFPLKSLSKDENLLIAKNCVFSITNKKIYGFVKPLE